MTINDIRNKKQESDNDPRNGTFWDIVGHRPQSVEIHAQKKAADPIRAGGRSLM
jgi:hypothetical protein